ncbi:hypothetical protein CYMTET_39983 [Cymbomonas tetramitiformis]|uniref:Dipeptidyl-peptidase n=1 Tax=Cymbomonas tetramitiformis TaxID=36881 RepID=A0AAE0C8Z6_9CHLO|nr:hypothetical protein CYMTET_39983 [Cymbomonas tetramitiformis]|eukprot:gene20748-24867_t
MSDILPTSMGDGAQERDPRFRSWPITEVSALEPMLKAMGLRVPASQIDGTASATGNCLSDALVSVGPAGRGGTGSFISADGLIITNHHVALDAVRQASTVEHDYLNDGFVARSHAEEIAGPDYEVWITRSCEDVSPAVLEVVQSEADPLKRANKVRDRKQEMASEREAALAGAAHGASMRCEVQEMWADKTYVLFTYERLRDVRIVYVPPLSLGCFGGDADNFEWPRHTADFTLLRAYVAPSGEGAPPSTHNVPYRPTQFLRANSAGAAAGDFVFLLGFPGHTMRYAPSSRLAFSDEVAVPELLEDFGAKLALIRAHTTDRAVALKLHSAKKGLANEYKRSRGKVAVMRKLGLLAERRAEEEALCAVAPDAAPLLARLAAIYDELRALAGTSAALDRLRGIYHGSVLLATAHAVHEAAIEAGKPDVEREAAYRERNLPFLVQRLAKRLKDLHPPHEVALLRRAVEGARAAAVCQEEAALAAWAFHEEAAAMALWEEEHGSSTPYHSQGIMGLEEGKLEAVLKGEVPPPDDAFVRCAAASYEAHVTDRDAHKALLSERDQLLAKLLAVQQEHAAACEPFYPDANGCLRLSAGHVEGYQAADAVMHTPMTTLAGLLEKHDDSSMLDAEEASEFACPPRLAELGRTDACVAATPVCLLYSTDTVGGNSGSPVLDRDGAFVAINFDRQRLGLMNEFKWSSKFSRSIGTDVRYILWLVGEYDGAGYLVDEMTK